MSKKSQLPQDRVFLTLHNTAREVISNIELSYDQYYEDSTPAIDSNTYRSQRGIRFISGEIYNHSRELQQSFENEYNELGEYIHGRAIHANGTIIED